MENRDKDLAKIRKDRKEMAVQVEKDKMDGLRDIQNLRALQNIVNNDEIRLDERREQDKRKEAEQAMKEAMRE
jgi:hypothetical protein